MNTVIASHLLPSGQTLALVHGDITEERVDALVNAANAHLAHGGGVAGAIAHKGGPEIQRKSDEWVYAHGLVPHEHPAITSAGRLPCRWVIHAVGPVWREGADDEDRKLRAAVTAALQLAHEWGLTSISIPAISTGIFGFPVDRGANIIVAAAADFCAANPDSSLREIRFTLIDRATLDVFAAEFRRRFGQR